MTGATTPGPAAPGPAEGIPDLAGQTVVVIGGSAGTGYETGRLARTQGAGILLSGRHAEPLGRAARELGARSTAAFDATNWAALDALFAGLPGQVDHALVT